MKEHMVTQPRVIPKQIISSMSASLQLGRMSDTLDTIKTTHLSTKVPKYSTPAKSLHQ